MTEAAINYSDVRNDYEIIEGVKYMAASAVFGHSILAGKLLFLFNSYFYERHNGIAACETDVNFPDGNILRPDLCVIDDLNIVDTKGKIHGVPALCVEVLSPSTAKRDFTKKKRIYANNGVKEYWIVDAEAKRIFVYHLIDDRYELDEVYYDYSEAELEDLTDDERAEVKTEIVVSIVPDLVIEVKRIFQFWWNS